MIGHVSVLLNVFGDAVMETCAFLSTVIVCLCWAFKAQRKSHTGSRLFPVLLIIGLTNTLTKTKGLSVGLFDFTGK